MPKDPIDPAAGSKVALAGQVVTVDRLTVADDDGSLDSIDKQTNLPHLVAPGLRKLY